MAAEELASNAAAASVVLVVQDSAVAVVKAVTVMSAEVISVEAPAA